MAWSMNLKSGSRLALVLCLFVLAGCGNSAVQNDFVFTGTNTPSAGSVTMNFVRPQAPLNVPGATTRLTLGFFSGPEATGTLLQQEDRDFSETITIEGVNAGARSVRVRARGANGEILAQGTANFVLVPGGNVVVDFGNTTLEFPALSSLVISPATATIQVAEMIGFTATGQDQFGQEILLEPGDVTWSVTTGNAVVVDANSGIATGVAEGNATVSAISGSVTAAATLTVTADGAPSVTLDPDSLLLTTGGAPVAAFPAATAGSGLANLAGGTLTVGANALGNQNISITLPTDPAIGVVSNNGTANVSVALNASATPANIETVLRGTTVAATGAGSGELEVTLSDGITTATATRAFAATGIRQLANGGFQDISAEPGALSFSLGDDQSTPVQDLGFDFTLFGTNFRNFVINTNGNITLSSFTDFSNSALPDPTAPELIAPYWDDLTGLINVFQPGPIYLVTLGTAPERRTVVQWEMYRHLGSTTDFETFQAVFYEAGNRLEFHYEETTEGGASATIGVQSNAGAEFFLFASDQAGSVFNGLSLEIIAP